MLAIFDLDGVIVSTDDYHFKAWKALADQYNLKFDRLLNEKLRGVSRKESLEIILDANGQKVNDSIFNRMLAEKNTMYRASLDGLDDRDNCFNR